MKVVFLDIDGVLNTDRVQEDAGWHSICPQCLANLVYIVRRTGAKIVLSSSWRLYADTREKLTAAFEQAGLSEAWIGNTEGSDSVPRAIEITNWLRYHSVSQFAILDDDVAAGAGMESHLFNTNSAYGLTSEIADRVVEFFSRRGQPSRPRGVAEGQGTAYQMDRSFRRGKNQSRS